MVTAEEPTAAQPIRNLPLRWRLWFIAGLLLTAYGVCVVLHWANQLDNIPTGLSTLAHICVTVLVLAGCIDVAVNRQDALGKRFDEVIAGNDLILRQLSAAPTLRLHEVRQTLDDTVQRVVGVAKVEAVKEIGTRVDGEHTKVDELWERFGDLEADLASFRLWQMQMQAHAEPPAVNGNGRASILRVLPSQPD